MCEAIVKVWCVLDPTTTMGLFIMLYRLCPQPAEPCSLSAFCLACARLTV